MAGGRPDRRSRLTGLGLRDADAGAAVLSRLGEAAEPLEALLGHVGDPDLALTGLDRLLDRLPDGAATAGTPDELARVLAEDEGTAMRLLAVLGASEALGDHLARHPAHWRELTDPTLGAVKPAAWWVRACLLRAVGADPEAEHPVAGVLPDPVTGVPPGDADATAALRVEYRRWLLRLAARDLAHHLPVGDVASELADLAAGALDAGLAIARLRVPTWTDARLGVIAMGKCGARELNYVSDVDVVFVHEPGGGADDPVDDARALRAATQLASQVIRACSEPTREGELWTVDAALRPEGKAGPLSRTLAGHVSYYERWASTWEFQALLKARAVAGDRDLGRRYVEAVRPFVWTAAGRDNFVADTQAMRRRVLEHLPAKDADRQLKLGAGGLRDVEFAVQLLQMVHGRIDETVRAPATLSALHDLTEGGYVGRQDGDRLHESYSFLRTLEHRIQLFRLRRTHVVPREVDDLRRLARTMGLRRDPAEALEKAWAHHRREVRRLHEKLFYRPLLTAVAGLAGDEVRLTPDAARARLQALGYRAPDAALRHLEALTAGVSRTAAIQRTLLPALLSWFAEGPDPDAGLFGFRRISESLGSTPWYLTTLRDEGEVARRLAEVLAGSRYATGLLEREPLGIHMLASDDDLAPRGSQALLEEMRLAVARRSDPDDAVRAVRAIRRRELFRIAAGDLLGLTDVVDVGRGLSRVTDATLEATLEAVSAAVCAQRGHDSPPARLAIVAMGRYGGFELSYASDADVLFVHEPAPGVEGPDAAAYAQAVCHEVRRLLALPGADPALVLDADLRPEGRQGALVRSLASYAAYYAKWSKVWEAQALLRADALVGDPDLCAAFTALVDPLRFPAGGLSDDDVLEVRRIKGRVDRERLPRGADPRTHLKLGRGGLADIEWSVQLLQMCHAHAVPGLRTTSTLGALAAAREAGLIDAEDAEVLQAGWRMVSEVRDAVTLVSGASEDQLPREHRDVGAVAMVLGRPQGSADALVNDLMRTMRHASSVVERVFWGS